MYKYKGNTITYDQEGRKEGERGFAEEIKRQTVMYRIKSSFEEQAQARQGNDERNQDNTTKGIRMGGWWTIDEVMTRLSFVLLLLLLKLVLIDHGNCTALFAETPHGALSV